ncbi:glycine cleavage system protein T [Enemella evansiae]|nr:glycine cleavage system protein T [Enemella evansiae]OYN95369.1 glycine cleavage system protein T [Enemella evansiae]
MTMDTLKDAIQKAGSPVELLRNKAARAATFPVAPEFTNWRSEQAAWRTTAALLDQSHHMTDLYISGPDALRLLTDFGVNSFAKTAPGKAKQYIATNGDGYLIGDAVLFHLEDELFDVVGQSTVINWLQYQAEKGGYKVDLERDENSMDRPSGPPKTYRYEIQGPVALEIIEKASGTSVSDVKFFNMADVTIAGHRVRGLRHGMAGQPGLEMFGPWEERDAVLDALLAAGEEYGMVRAGAKAYATANLESGWVPAVVPAIFGDAEAGYREWLPVNQVASLAGSMDSAEISDYYVTPYEIGYGRSVKFDHDFLGREALEKMADQPHREKVTLVWNADDVAAAMKTLLEPGTPAKYMELPKSRYGLYQHDKVLRDGKQVGVSLDVGYINNEHAFVSLATVDPDLTQGTEVTVVWGEQPNSKKPLVEEHRQIELRATVEPCPIAQGTRASYRAS